jgi:hypothetical protein
MLKPVSAEKPPLNLWEGERQEDDESGLLSTDLSDRIERKSHVWSINPFNPILESVDSTWGQRTSHLGVKPGIAHFIQAQMDHVQGEKEAHEGKDRG